MIVALILILMVGVLPIAVVMTTFLVQMHNLQKRNPNAHRAVCRALGLWPTSNEPSFSERFTANYNEWMSGQTYVKFWKSKRGWHWDCYACGKRSDRTAFEDRETAGRVCFGHSCVHKVTLA